MSLVYIILAALGLGLLIFIHELGHYFMARRVGMKVEAFGIGFGKPIKSWDFDGVKWNLGWIPFGGYVKIAGMEPDGEQDLYKIPGGFFSKSPWDRIKVAFAGPFVNILFAFLCFVVVWGTGGREKDYAEFTHVIGWVDPRSELYAKGVRPGDVITGYDNNEYRGRTDHIYAPMTASDTIIVQGYHVNQRTHEKKPFEYTVKPYHPNVFKKDFLSAGIIHPASYVIFTPAESSKTFVEGSPMADSGIQPYERIAWVDGLAVYSLEQLHQILNDGKAFLTIQRNGKKMFARVPRVRVEELKLDSEVREELTDWQHEAQLISTKIPQLYFIPYNLTPDAVVENQLKFIDKEDQEQEFPANPFSEIAQPLQKGDKIIAVDGVPIKQAFQLLYQLQERKVNVIVQRLDASKTNISSLEADNQFLQENDWKTIDALVTAIGTNAQPKESNGYRLLKPVKPITHKELASTPEKQALENEQLMKTKKEIEAISDPEERAQAQQLLNQYEKQLILGITVKDRQVNYNPNPIQLFTGICEEIWRTLSALVSGNLKPKWMAGPVGIVKVVHDSWLLGFRDVLYWMGAISLNLAILNLLPIPVLDGGYICLFLLEMVTGRQLKPKTLERLIVPFVVLLVGFLLYATYNDIMRLLTSYVGW